MYLLGSMALVALFGLYWGVRLWKFHDALRRW